MRWPICLAALALAACGPDKPDPLARTQPDVAANFNQPLDARGVDPAWGMKIRGTQLTINRPGQADVVVTAPGAVITRDEASWTAPMRDGRPVKISLYASACSDGTSDLRYAFSAELDLPDSSPMSGCAGPPAQAPALRTARR